MTFVVGSPPLTFRKINAVADAAVCVQNYKDTYAASYDEDPRFVSVSKYLSWLKDRVDEYPDGHVLAYEGEQCIGQLELQVPYGLSTGYINLYCVTPACRRQGYGRLLHAYAERYFRSWDATRIELHVSPNNTAARKFYLSMDYTFVRTEGRLWRLGKRI